TLEEVLDVAKDRAVVFLELKRGRGIVDAVQKVIDARPEQREQIVIISFEARLLRKAAKALPDIPRMLLFKKRARYGRNMLWLARRARATMVGLDFAKIQPRDVRLAHKRAMPVYAYTVNDLPRVATLVRMGIDGVITDRPFRASEVTATQTREYAARP
ncbi:MAG: glycerophosphodiester phosphodiesterase, partial [Nannocystaceae bacterium]